MVLAMKTVTIRDLRSQPRQVREELAKASEAVLTANGKPVALILSVDSGTLDETLETVRRARAMQSLAKLRKNARDSGRDNLRMKDIDAEIQASRKARRRKAKRTGRA